MRRQAEIVGKKQWILPVCILIWLGAAHLSALLPQPHHAHTLFTMAPPNIVVGMALLLLCIILWRRRTKGRPLALAVGSCLLLGPGLLSFSIPSSRQFPSSKEPDVRVMSLNVHYESRYLIRALDQARQNKLDLILLQENKGDGELMGDWLAKELGGWHQVHVGETAILSRWPLTDVRARELPVENWRSILSATVNGPKTFRAVTCHWTIDRFFEPGDGLDRGAKAQRANLLATLEECRNQGMPVILGGDFNNTPRNGLTRALSAEMINCFDAAGWGPGWTFPSRAPVLRIDHLYVSDGAVPLKSWVGPDVGSDHRPIFAEIALPEKGQR